MHNIVEEKNQNRLLQWAAQHLCEKIRGVLDIRENFNLAVPGGRNAAKIFQAMQEEQADWRRVHYFIIDESLVPIVHPDSNYKLLQDHLVGPL